MGGGVVLILLYESGGSGNSSQARPRCPVKHLWVQPSAATSNIRPRVIGSQRTAEWPLVRRPRELLNSYIDASGTKSSMRGQLLWYSLCKNLPLVVLLHCHLRKSAYHLLNTVQAVVETFWQYWWHYWAGLETSGASIPRFPMFGSCSGADTADSLPACSDGLGWDCVSLDFYLKKNMIIVDCLASSFYKIWIIVGDGYLLLQERLIYSTSCIPFQSNRADAMWGQERK